ncbi:MAG: TetR/AcrR family transcriptional regulator, partial [Ignavibacteria bacterium]
MVKTRKELEKEIRQNYIVDAAEQLFAVKDFDKTTMDEIAVKAQFSKATLYKYVKSKDELALLVYRKINRIKVGWLKEKIDSQDNGYEKLFTFCETYFNFFKKYPQYLKFQIYLDYKGLLKSNFRSTPAEFNEYFADEINYMKEVYHQGIEDGTLRDDV